jgi:hypothetical protein
MGVMAIVLPVRAWQLPLKRDAVGLQLHICITAAVREVGCTCSIASRQGEAQQARPGVTDGSFETRAGCVVLHMHAGGD